MKHPVSSLVRFFCFILCILIAEGNQAQSPSGSTDTQVNYCRLISAGLYYGSIESEQSGTLPQAVVDRFNGLWRTVYQDATYQVGITSHELTDDQRFSFGNKAGFPSAARYHRDHPDGYLVFHLAREAGRVKSPTHAACADCVRESIDRINTLLRGTQLERQIGQLWAGSGVIRRIASAQDVKDLAFFLHCLFYDAKVRPESSPEGLNLSPLMVTPDTTRITCKKDIQPEFTIVWRHCELTGKADTIGPVLVSGIDNCHGSIYRYTFVAKDVCNRVDSVHQFFVIENDPPEIACRADTVVTCIDELDATIRSFESSCGLAVMDSVYGPVLLSGTHNCPDAEYEMAYFVTDTCGRTAGCLQKVRIENDPPHIECPPDQLVSCPDQIQPSTPLITTACQLGYDITHDPPVLVSGQGTCPGDVYEIRYTVSDVCGRTNSCVQRFVIDNAGPSVQCPPGEFVTCVDDITAGLPEIMKTACGIEPDLLVSDPVLISGIPECALSEYAVTYMVTDECGRTASCEQLFTLIDLPVEIDCPDDRVVACKDDMAAELPDVRSPCPVAYQIDQSDPVLVQGDDNCPGAVYEIQYQYRDACGDEQLCIQRFTIENDPPEVSCPPDRIVERVDDIEVDTAMARVACDLGYDLRHDGPLLVSGTANCPDAIYEVTIHLEDECGREAECVQRFTISNAEPEIICPDDGIIFCVEDIVAGEPEYLVAPGLGYTLEQDQVPQLISGTDNCPGVVYVIEHRITDDCGRTAACHQHFVIDTNDPPTIECPPDKVVRCAADIYGDYPTWTSSCSDADVTTSDPVLVQGVHNCPGATYAVTHTVTDQCGRTASCVQHYTLEGEPIVILCPPDTTIRFGDNIEVIAPHIRASCSQPYRLQSTPLVLVSGTDGLPGAVYHVRHTVEDDCNNTAACTQRIDIVGLVPDGSDRLCDCYQDRPVGRVYVEDRTLRFMEDAAGLLKVYGCKKVVSWAKDDVKSLWDAWASNDIIGADRGYASLLARRGSIDLVIQNMAHVDKAIEVLEEALSGDTKKAVEIFSEYVMLEYIKYISGTGTPGLVYAAVKSLGDFAKYLNHEIMITNIKTYAGHANQDPHFFHPDTFLLNYANIREIKPGDPITWNDVYNDHRIAVYLYAQVHNMALPRASEVWSDQRKMNTLRAITKAMLNEVCDYWCYRRQLVNDLNNLRNEQSVLKRFEATLDHFINMQCTGDVICDIPNAEIRHIAGRDTCVCLDGYMPDPGRTRCIPYEDCTQKPNTVLAYRGDRYACVCEAGFDFDPDGINCVPDVECDPAMNVHKVFTGSGYACDCLPGYMWTPDQSRCVPYDDCGLATHAGLYFDTDRYLCVCNQGYKWSPDRTDCIPADDCMAMPNTVSVFRGDHYACDCVPGYKKDPSGTNCVPAEDCTNKPNMQQVFRHGAYVCECLPGYTMRADGTGCDALLDCSAFPNSITVWNAAINDYECDCRPGFEWNDDYTACEVILDCSAYPNSVPVWNGAINDYECDCPQGYEWNDTYTACIESVPDCGFYYANTMAVFNAVTKQYECDCLPGYAWNATRDGCIESRVMTCDIPNAVLRYDRFNNEYYCECEPGYRWNARKTACIKRAEPLDPSVAADILTGLTGILAGVSGAHSTDNPVVSPENQRTGQCNVSYKSGANAPEQYTIDVHQAFGSVLFEYETFTVKDRIQIYNGSRLIFDSGCVGTRGIKSTSLQLSGSSVFRIVVNPLCDPDENNTEWNFKLGCP